MKILRAWMVVCVGALVGCGGDDGGRAPDVQNAAARFADPIGPSVSRTQSAFNGAGDAKGLAG